VVSVQRKWFFHFAFIDGFETKRRSPAMQALQTRAKPLLLIWVMLFDYGGAAH
jgi:hypothetical protein